MEITQQYPNQCVVIEFMQLNDELNVVDGWVLTHSPSVIEMVEGTSDAQEAAKSLEFTCDRDTGEVCLIGAMAKILNETNRSKFNKNQGYVPYIPAGDPLLEATEADHSRTRAVRLISPNDDPKQPEITVLV